MDDSYLWFMNESVGLDYNKIISAIELDTIF